MNHLLWWSRENFYVIINDVMSTKKFIKDAQMEKENFHSLSMTWFCKFIVYFKKGGTTMVLIFIFIFKKGDNTQKIYKKMISPVS